LEAIDDYETSLYDYKRLKYNFFSALASNIGFNFGIKLEELSVVTLSA
jgi:hypothetical protein